MIRASVIAAFLATSAAAQGTLVETPNDQADATAGSIRALEGTGAELRMLDKVSGDVVDTTLALGESTSLGRNPTGEAYAYLDVRDPARDAILFQGWMVATSPALNALDHARYDVWVIRCRTA